MLSDDQYILNFRQQVGGNLRRLRRANGMSQSKLAERAGLNRSYLSMVENGRRNISLDNLVSLALALKVEPIELFSHVEATTKPVEAAKAAE
ncbi:helix-turn-helix transcriptional regulator [Persicimonas caeni]|uniref:Helix-turn-helix transcriptional regulator n=1 Tax=Persicimonas caeni TaxID=2292766 RepID=A0A4Y6PSA2_PERCE|nr:helix-turn-helix transcriptional regulator [Persicimonas caeni]QDG51188.1 helix-turn-helix transcriptional regulator [Persicimonas caeni]QED32409.1 helix-turn-helix transcriptional regulator [Persicimonas caeni]